MVINSSYWSYSFGMHFCTTSIAKNIALLFGILGSRSTFFLTKSCFFRKKKIQKLINIQKYSIAFELIYSNTFFKIFFMIEEYAGFTL